MPQKTEIKNVNFKASRLHFLGGVAGWGYPCCGENKDLPVAKVMVNYAGDESEEFILKNGVEFADWNGQAEVPGSKIVPDVVRHGQVRSFSRDLARSGAIQSITLESFDNSVAPVFVAITAEAGGAAAKVADASGTIVPGEKPAEFAIKRQDIASAELQEGSSQANLSIKLNTAKARELAAVTTENVGKRLSVRVEERVVATPIIRSPIATGTFVVSGAGGGETVQLAKALADSGVAVKGIESAPMTWGAGMKVLLVGGGTSHDFHKFFDLADAATLKAAGCAVNYTEDADATARELSKVDVAVLSVNKAGWDTPEVRKALFDFADAGKGIVLLHAGVWLNYPKWPEYNAQIVGGMSRGHDRLGEFEVKVLQPSHPIMKGVPESFRITDELYYFNADPNGTPIEVLAQTSTANGTKKQHPSVWVVKHPKARIAGVALGHDARAHGLPAFKQLFVNAVKWSAGKD